jgi:hypothetical protein
MIPKGAFGLTAEQSVRLAICQSVERDKLIAGIVAHLRKHAQPRNDKAFAGGQPRAWYASRVTI